MKRLPLLQVLRISFLILFILCIRNISQAQENQATKKEGKKTNKTESKAETLKFAKGDSVIEISKLFATRIDLRPIGLKVFNGKEKFEVLSSDESGTSFLIMNPDARGVIHLYAKKINGKYTNKSRSTYLKVTDGSTINYESLYMKEGYFILQTDKGVLTNVGYVRLDNLFGVEKLNTLTYSINFIEKQNQYGAYIGMLGSTTFFVIGMKDKNVYKMEGK